MYIGRDLGVETFIPNGLLFQAEIRSLKEVKQRGKAGVCYNEPSLERRDEEEVYRSFVPGWRFLRLRDGGLAR